MKPHGDRRHKAKILVWQGLSGVNSGIDDSSGRAIPRKGIDMWIRRTVRLLVVALFALEISIIALASAASAAPIAPGEEPRPAPAPIIRVYQLGGAYQAPQWYAALDEAATTAAETYNVPTAQEAAVPRERRPEARAGKAGIGWKQSARPRAKQARRPLVNLRRALPRQATVQLSHANASRWLKQAGLRWRSTGNCTDKRLRYCTSLDAVRTSTVSGLIELKQLSGCRVMVTGGTEAGHAPGPLSHGAGYKADISPNPCIDRFITQNYDRAGMRSDGSRLYRSESGTVFADEGDHWDILFR
jgi:hypothetical protein